MKKNYWKSLLGIIFIFFTICIIACSKNIPIENHPSTVVEYQKIADSIIKDSSFKILIADFIIESDKLSSTVATNNTVVSSNELLFKSIALFIIQNKQLHQLNKSTLKNIYKYIIDSSCSQSYLLNHKLAQENILSIKSVIHQENRSTFNVNSDQNSAQRINQDDLLNCAITAAIGALSSYGEAINDIGILIRGGSPIGLLLDMSIDILKNASPWWKVSSVVLTFSACLYFR
jgi:hypothetical protein